MRIEDEIKQKEFKSEYQKLMINIMFTSSWLSSVHHQHLKPFGISSQQYNLLRILKGQHPNPASVNLLIDRMIDKNSNASRLVEKLRQKGLLERKECLEDRRRVDVVITDAGLELLDQMDPKMGELSHLSERLTEEEARAANLALDKMRD